MIKREWLLGVGLISAGIGAGLSPMGANPALAQSATEIGTVAAVKPDAFGSAPSAAEQTLNIGAGLVENEKIRTTADGTANVIFADRSSLTVGKGSEVVLDKFVYDPGAKSGGIALTLTQGALRFVGGQLSKTGDVQVKTPTATMTVRGGIAIFYTPPGGGVSYGIFLYGKELKDLKSGQSIFQPGYAFKINPDGSTEIFKITDAFLAEILKNFNSETGLGGELPDQDLALLEDNPQLIDDLRKQIEDESQRDDTVLDSLRQFLSTTTIPDTTGPYGT